MKVLSFILLILICLHAGAQEKNYLQYHRQIIEAEEYFLNGDIDKSLEKYRQTFEQYKPFAKDCYVALQLCCANNDTARAGYMASKCFERGVSWKMLEAVTKIQVYMRTHPKHKANWEQMYKEKRNKYLSDLDWDVRAHVDALILRDNVYKSIPYEAIKRNDKLLLCGKILDKNLLELIEIVKKEGIPGQQLIGAYDYDLDRLSDVEKVTLHSIPNLIFFHHPYGYHLLKKELMTAVLNGEILPKEYALIHDWSYAVLKRLEINSRYPDSTLTHQRGLNMFKYKVTAPVMEEDEIYNVYHSSQYHSRDTVFVNKCRRELAIASLEHDKRKKEYEQRKQLILFFGIFRNF